MKKNKILFLLAIFTIIFNISCSSVFSATISGTIKAEPRNNSSAEEQTNLSNANVYIFFNNSEWNEYKQKWENYSTHSSRSITSTIEMPIVSDTIRLTTTNQNGGFSLKTMWVTTSPLFGKDGDEKSFHISVYHKDYGMFFDNSEYSVFSDSSQNISYICQYDEKLKTNYSISFDIFDYSNNNSSIALETVNPKVVLKYKLYNVDNKESEIGEITQIYENLPSSNNKTKFSFICDKYYYDNTNKKYSNELVYPKGKIYFYDKGAIGEKTFRMVDENGLDLTEIGTPFEITSNSNNLIKNVYVDRLNRDYRIKFNIDYPQNDECDNSGTAPTIEQFSPKATIKVYFDGYDNSTNTIKSKNQIINEDELYKTFNFSVDEVPQDGYYTFNVDRFFDSNQNEIFPSVTFSLEDDKNNVEYIQTDINGNIINNSNEIEKTLTNYSKDNYTTSVDTYVDKVKLNYTIQFNIENYEDGSNVTLSTSNNENNSTYNAKIKLFILAYDGLSNSLSSLDFSNAVIKYPDQNINENTISFEWNKYNKDGQIQYPVLKYYIYNDINPNYCQVTSADNITYTHINSEAQAKENVESIIFRKGILSKSVDVNVEKLNEDYSINFTLNNIEDNNNNISFKEFNPKVKLNIYKTNTDNSNLVESKYYKTANSNGIYNFNWEKYGKNIDLIDLPDIVNTDVSYPIVKYYLFNTDSDSYQMLKSNETDNPIEITSLENSLYTSYFEDETEKDIDVYIRTKKIKFNITFNLINLATNNNLSLTNIDPIIRLSYFDGEKNIIDTFNNIPINNEYNIEVKRDTTISTAIKVDLQDKRSEVRYRLSSNDPNNSDPSLRYTVGESDSNRYNEEFTLTKANDNELKLYIKDFQYPQSINIEGRFIDNNSTLDNDHDLWLIPKINGLFNEDDAIKFTSPTHQNYKNNSDSFNPDNIENGYFNTNYKQSRIANFNEYPNSSKYLDQQFKIVVNKVQNENNPKIDNSDYMSIFTLNNNSNNSTYVYVDNSIAYTN